jgi:L,D-peptidoglycan transpeptidase YkuD (ErfK/YbiS/YcfS/YnhG family)
MPEQRPIEMRRKSSAAAARRRAVGLAATVGALALVVAIGAVIVGTFPKPDLSTSPSPRRPAATAAAIIPNTVATSATVSVTSSPVATKEPAKTAAPVAKKPVAKKKPAAKKKAKKATPALPPLGMARVLSGSKQIIVVTGPKLGSTHGKVRIYNLAGGKWKQVLSAPARFGTNGLIEGTKRRQGTRTTPTGIWWPGTWVWGWHKSPPPRTLMPYRQTTKKVWWSAENNSTYNTWVVSSHRIDGEHLVDVRIQYEYALSSGYNAPPNKVVRGRGTAIFLHVFDPPDYHNGLSAGCIGISRANMIKVFQIMDPARKPCFAIGTESTGAGSIRSY